MELPIDHFRLLGVSPTTDGETVLRTLQQRLDRAPDQGFTHDTLQARADLLRSSADLLSDDGRRLAYERELTSIANRDAGAMAGLEIPLSREVGGLLLLMESGQAHEAFDAASRGLQPPQAPALGSSREADLTLLAGIACMAAARDYRSQRRYEAAARTLQEGLQLLQRMGQLPDQRRQLEQELLSLQPYRVLDLLSRDLSATAARSEGIALLDEMVQRRGGLEGDADPDFPATEFQPFFQQIRRFLTVQEQLDLFNRWAAAGWSTSSTLSSLALTASGFVQRKPERIQAALQRLESGGGRGMELAMACQQLLLGQVEQAQVLFEAAPSAPLQVWSLSQREDPLAVLCEHCRDWLRREVLPGFRDIEAEPDLEAWYADRDVQAYIDQQDRIRGRRPAADSAPEQAPPALEPPSPFPPLPELDWGSFEGFGSVTLGASPLEELTGSGTAPDASAAAPEPLPSALGTVPGSPAAAGAAGLFGEGVAAGPTSAPAEAGEDAFSAFGRGESTPAPTPASPAGSLVAEDDDLWEAPPFWSGWKLRERLRQWRSRPRPEPAAARSRIAYGPVWLLPLGLILAVGAGGGLAWLLLRSGSERARPIPVQPSTATSAPRPQARPAAPVRAIAAATPSRPAAPAPRPADPLPLQVASPGEDQLRTLLDAWLQAKAASLAGRSVERPLAELARPLMISRLDSQKADNASRGEVETIEVSLQSLEVLERTPERITAAVTMRYSDERRDASGRIVSRTPAGDLRNTYVFVRDGGTWTVAAFRPGS